MRDEGMIFPANNQPCRKCGMPGAVLHYPGGYLCPGGCNLPVITGGGVVPEPNCLTDLEEDVTGKTRIRLAEALTRIKSLEEQNAKLREAVKDCEKFIHSVGRHAHLFHHSCGCGLLMKKSTDSINAIELEPKDQP